MAIRLIGRVEKELGKTFSLAALFQSPTIEGLAEELREKRRLPGLPLLVPFRTQRYEAAMFVHGGSFELSRHLGEDQAMLSAGAAWAGWRGAPETVEEMARGLSAANAFGAAEGPYLIGGLFVWWSGGL